MAEVPERSSLAVIVALSAVMVGAYAIMISGVFSFVFDPR